MNINLQALLLGWNQTFAPASSEPLSFVKDMRDIGYSHLLEPERTDREDVHHPYSKNPYTLSRNPHVLLYGYHPWEMLAAGQYQSTHPPIIIEYRSYCTHDHPGDAASYRSYAHPDELADWLEYWKFLKRSPTPLSYVLRD